MKRLKDESDLTLINEMEFYLSPSYRDMLFIFLLIILYYSNHARTVFWILIILTIIYFVGYFAITRENEIRLILIRNELIRRGVYKK